MFVDQFGGLWLSGPLGLLLVLGALLVVIWADAGLSMRPIRARAQALRATRRRRKFRAIGRPAGANRFAA